MNHLNVNPLQVETTINPRSSQGDCAEVLADIYQDDVNISIWQRTLSSELLHAAERILKLKYAFRFSASVTPKDVFDSLNTALGANTESAVISADIAEIVAMFCCLFDLQQVGLRLTTLDRAMCPKFHVDRVPCRLATTYSGIATEWLLHEDVDRAKLGIGIPGKSDEESGVYNDPSQVHQLTAGDIALLKGESWLGNEGCGLVHRSPNLVNPNKRLLLTLDFN
ncbi:MAG: hypothetical protein ACI854_002719 [Arenicella sp.]|jgi:hypothetical protein